MEFPRSDHFDGGKSLKVQRSAPVRAQQNARASQLCSSFFTSTVLLYYVHILSASTLPLPYSEEATAFRSLPKEADHLI
jgi:hypothetical protein